MQKIGGAPAKVKGANKKSSRKVESFEIDESLEEGRKKKRSAKSKGFSYSIYLFFKRFFDILTSGLMLICVSPLLAVVLLLKWLEDCIHSSYRLEIVPAEGEKPKKRVTRVTRSDGEQFDCKLIPVKNEKGKGRASSPIYSSIRVGKGGKEFKFYKIRSMCPGAEDMKDQLIAAGLNESDGPAFKMKDDPRITRFGKFLRKTSIDELPQLFNIFIGDMSVIGPRPPLPKEVEQYTEEQMHRLDVQGGLLCLWQIQHNRNSMTFDQWVDLDLEYIENRDLWYDAKILFSGAYMVIFDHSGE
jgi:lipopolysaccharide/colanic/teichoic acid biosynthesis glycosyltransferase